MSETRQGTASREGMRPGEGQEGVVPDDPEIGSTWAPMPKSYDPKAIEGPIFSSWQEAGYFERSMGIEGKDPFTIVIPPPNVTGVLHIGHALNGTIQDILVRHARMQGRPTRWIVGTDHAGIATQNRVEKRLASRGLTRFDVGREKFVDECWKWREEYGGTIINQFKALGCSCDYADEKFTMSPEYQRAVRKVFVTWYDDGLIYRGHRIINWCPRCGTALSDAEVEHAEQPEAGHLWYLRYPLKDPVGEVTYVVIATTRPETMLGDVAVAVSPTDERFRKLVGATIVLPVLGREIPIIADGYVDESFGTGAVKITPAHDPNDFEVGLRHDLEQINILNKDATINANGGEFAGMDRYAARDAIVARFDDLGLLDHVEEHDHQPGHCYRCGTVIEPWLSDQWFVKMGPLAEPALDVVRDGRIKFYPQRWDATYYAWLENVRDWCISRQLWWGHRIPVFYCDECGWRGASEEDLTACPACGGTVRQDEDVLDTWFSSQMWPFATMGWSGEGRAHEELERYYPTQVLSTAPDILFLWVARMVFSSLYFMDGQVPFESVIYHPTVLDKNGDRMSKSRGNGIDPLDLIERWGTDAIRFHLAKHVTGAQSFRLDPDRIVTERNFITKIWNAARFVQMNLDGYVAGEPLAVEPVDRWILSRLASLVAQVDAQLEGFEIADVTTELYNFFWNEFCDWYLEFSKPRLYGDDPRQRLIAQRNLVFVLDNALRLLHPIMPFVTEEIWRSMPHLGDAPSLMVAAWPAADTLASFADADAEHAVDLAIATIAAVRSVRARYGISSREPLAVAVKAAVPGDAALLLTQTDLAAQLANLVSLEVTADAEKPAHAIAQLSGDIEVFVVLGDLVDFAAERGRLDKEMGRVRADLAKSEGKLGNESFVAKAAPAAVDKERAKHDELLGVLETLGDQLADLAE